MIMAIVGTIAGFGILSNDIILNAQSITVWNDLAEFDDHDCECDLGNPPSCDDLSDHAKMLCGLTPPP